MRSFAKILLPVAVVAAGALVAVLLVRAAPEAATREPTTPPPLVRVIEVAPENVRLDVHAQGTVTPRTEATLVAQVGGRIVEAAPAFAAGGSFSAGQVLLRIDPSDYRLAVEQAEAQVAQAETRLARERAEGRVAREEWEELKPRAEPDPLALREPQLAEARAALRGAEAQLEQARLNLERTTIEAPFAGRVAEKQADVGQSVTPGTPLGRVFATDYAEVPLPVPVAELAYLEIDLAREMEDGPRVALSAELAGARRTWPARIVRTAGSIDRQTRMLGLIARVDRPYGTAADEGGTPLPMGLFVDATIAGRRAEGVIVLPRSALREVSGRSRTRAASSDAGRRAASAADDGTLERHRGRVLVAEEGADHGARPDEATRLRFREVEILRLAGDRALISGGLSPGDRVAISPIDTPVDGMAVRLAEDGAGPAVGDRREQWDSTREAER